MKKQRMLILIQNKKPISGVDEAILVIKILECAQKSLDKKGKEIKIKF